MIAKAPPLFRVRNWANLYENNRSVANLGGRPGSRRQTISEPIGTRNLCLTTTARPIWESGMPC